MLHAFLSPKQPTASDLLKSSTIPFTSLQPPLKIIFAPPPSSLLQILPQTMNNVDNYSAFLTPMMPYNPSNDPLYCNHGDIIEYNVPPLKRSRESPLSFVSDDIFSQILQQTQDVDGLILYHVEKVRSELLDHHRRCWSQALAVLEERALKRLRAKDEEIDRIGKLNLAMEERIKVLRLDCNIARITAQTNEADMMGLRSNLLQLIAAQEMRCQVVGVADDAESCCGFHEEQQQFDTAGSGATRICRNCLKGEASVLLLPCRHLCLCSTCGPVMNECPVCKSSKDGSVNVNMF